MSKSPTARCPGVFHYDARYSDRLTSPKVPLRGMPLHADRYVTWTGRAFEVLLTGPHSLRIGIRATPPKATQPRSALGFRVPRGILLYLDVATAADWKKIQYLVPSSDRTLIASALHFTGGPATSHTSPHDPLDALPVIRWARIPCDALECAIVQAAHTTVQEITGSGVCTDPSYLTSDLVLQAYRQQAAPVLGSRKQRRKILQQVADMIIMDDARFRHNRPDELVGQEELLLRVMLRSLDAGGPGDAMEVVERYARKQSKATLGVSLASDRGRTPALVSTRTLQKRPADLAPLPSTRDFARARARGFGAAIFANSFFDQLVSLPLAWQFRSTATLAMRGLKIFRDIASHALWAKTELATRTERLYEREGYDRLAQADAHDASRWFRRAAQAAEARKWWGEFGTLGSTRINNRATVIALHILAAYSAWQAGDSRQPWLIRFKRSRLKEARRNFPALRALSPEDQWAHGWGPALAALVHSFTARKLYWHAAQALKESRSLYDTLTEALQLLPKDIQDAFTLNLWQWRKSLEDTGNLLHGTLTQRDAAQTLQEQAERFGESDLDVALLSLAP